MGLDVCGGGIVPVRRVERVLYQLSVLRCGTAASDSAGSLAGDWKMQKKQEGGMRKNYRKWMVPVILIFAFFMQGCSAQELENRCFPMLAAVDYKDGQVEFFYGFPGLSQADNTDMEEAKVNAAKTTGDSFASCVRLYEEELSRKTDCNHLKVLVIGKDLLENQKQYDAMLSYLKDTELYPRNTYVCVTEDVDALLECEADLPEDMGTYLESYLQNHESDRQVALFNIGKLIDEKENRMKAVSLPYLEVEDGVILWENCYKLNKE